MAVSNSIVARSRAKRCDIESEVAIMQGMTIGRLRERYAEVFGESTRSRHKKQLIRKIAWRIQALAKGDLTERARQRAGELANDADVRVRPPKAQRVETPADVTPIVHNPAFRQSTVRLSASTRDAQFASS